MKITVVETVTIVIAFLTLMVAFITWRISVASKQVADESKQIASTSLELARTDSIKILLLAIKELEIQSRQVFTNPNMNHYLVRSHLNSYWYTIEDECETTTSITPGTIKDIKQLEPKIINFSDEYLSYYRGNQSDDASELFAKEFECFSHYCHKLISQIKSNC